MEARLQSVSVATYVDTSQAIDGGNLPDIPSASKVVSNWKSSSIRGFVLRKIKELSILILQAVGLTELLHTHIRIISDLGPI
jgi:hypothetical protein|tara:strand:+ start:334 stop:579 length:246 start_codon:yes stop_codon:yes gene_type:complete